MSARTTMVRPDGGRGAFGRVLGCSALGACLATFLVCGVLGSNMADAQGRRGGGAAGGPAAGGPPPPPPTAKAQAPFDLDGYWVSLITEAWHYRMIVPGPSDYDEIPLSLEGKLAADKFNASAEEAAGGACKAYGAPVIMWTPGRLHISWANDETLRVDTDAGQQTRLLKFKPTDEDKAAAPSLQGLTTAEWVMHGVGPPGGRRPPAAGPPGPRYGYIKAETTDLLPGLFRKNGVPYGGKTTHMTEYWESHAAQASFGGGQWLIVTTRVTDPTYLFDPYVFSPVFRKESDGSKWNPQPCSLKW